ncbi:MAG: hypothetical protein H7Z41_05150 [Cytophagales bacterium]|nr:hypothetical protein [Armatimonadota bacterium]
MTFQPRQDPADALQPLTDLASRSDVLIFGEVHGTQEVPQLVTGLMKELKRLGYWGLALEIPSDQRSGLVNWAKGKEPNPPPFFTQPSPDGRGNRQVLECVQDAVRRGWEILCFDVEPGQPSRRWSQRDANMARNFTGQRDRLCPGRKVVGICGNLHSRLSRASGDFADLWPSFAFCLQRLNANEVISTVSVEFHQGQFYNGGQARPVYGVPIAQAFLQKEKDSGHSLVLHLPTATPATFLASPRA